MFKDCAGNPIITSVFTADPSAHVWETEPDRLYLYPSTDVFPAHGCDMMDRYHVFSTNNMADWIDHGEILRRDDLPEDVWGPHYKDSYFMWAPDAAYNENCPDGKGPYFYYFPHKHNARREKDDGWKVGVAWSNSPCTGFKDHEVIMMMDKDGKPFSGFIDPCVFRDGDDYYMVIGGAQECRIAKMNPNMMQLAEDFVILSQNNAHQSDSPYYNKLPHYHEGPWLFTRVNDLGVKIYYLMYPGAIGGKGDDMLYAVSDNPYGPWEYKGSFLKPVGTGDTSHGSIVEFKGKWYVFYHNAEISGAGNLRSVCADELFWNPDGTIIPVKQTMSGTKAVAERVPAGTPGLEVKYYDITNAAQGSFTEKASYSVDSANCNVVNADLIGGMVHNMQNDGAYIEFTGVDGGDGGRALLTVTYAAESRAAGKADTSGDTSGEGYFLKLAATGSWDDATGRASCIIDLLPGANNTIRLSGGMGGYNTKAITISMA